MSRTTHISTARSLVVVGIITGATLGAPAASHAQTGDGERALLNRVAAPAGATAARALRLAAEYAVSPDPVDGQRALIVRIASATVTPGELDAVVVQPIAEVQITGPRALLGAATTRR
jgi:hypothetical protein